jgi:hypothetical protein
MGFRRGRCNACYSAHWRRKNPEASKAIAAKSYAKNREKDNARSNAHYAKNREARLEKQKAHYDANREKRIAYNKDYHATNIERMRAYFRRYRLDRKYGITVEAYDAMLEQQKGVCAICGNGQTAVSRDGIKRLHIDHCHAEGRVRGLLCLKCNTALHFIENEEWMKRARKYLG